MQNNQTAAKLQALGLTDKQARVYAATLFLGAATALAISKQADLNRSTTYLILDELIAMALVSQSSDGGKTVFVTNGPEALDAWLKRQAEQITERQTQLAAMATELQSVSRENGADAPQVRFFKGQAGVNEINDYFLRKAKAGSMLYGYENVDEVERTIPGRVAKSPSERRLPKRLGMRLIFSYSRDDLAMGKAVLREGIRVKHPVKANFTVYDTGIVMSTYGRTPDDATAIAIEHPEIVAAMRDLIELIWEQSPNILK